MSNGFARVNKHGSRLPGRWRVYTAGTVGWSGIMSADRIEARDLCVDRHSPNEQILVRRGKGESLSILAYKYTFIPEADVSPILGPELFYR